MSESDGNRKRAISSVSTEDGSTGTFAGPSGTTAAFTTYPAALAPAAPPPPPAATGNNKKRHKKGTRAASTAGAQIHLPPGVVISRSAEDCAPQLNLSKDQLIVTGSKGFRMARATHGVSQGTWFWECTVLPPETREGHCRLGWSLPTGSLQAPVGYDKSSYAYRDIAGSKVHELLRTDNYGEPWGPGDVIGFMIKLKSPSPEELRDAPGVDGDSGRLSVSAAAATLATAGVSSSERGTAGGGAGTAAGGAGANAGNEIRFFKNGKDQNVAFSGIKPGMYFPAVSLYMGGSVRVNFGPEFVYPPLSSHRCKPIANLRPLSKEEAKAQRTRTKQERAARGLETATRLSAGGSYLGTTSRSPPRSSPSQVSTAIPSRGGAQQRGSNGDGAAGSRSSKSGERGDVKSAAPREEASREQAAGGKVRRASSPAPGGSSDKGGKGSGRDNDGKDRKTELEVAKDGTKGAPLGVTNAKDRVVDAAGNQKASGTQEVKIRGDAAPGYAAAVLTLRDVTAVEKAVVGKEGELSNPTTSAEQGGVVKECPRNTASGEPKVSGLPREGGGKGASDGSPPRKDTRPTADRGQDDKRPSSRPSTSAIDDEGRPAPMDVDGSEETRLNGVGVQDGKRGHNSLHT